MKKRNRGACAKMHEQIVELSKTVTFSEACNQLNIPKTTLKSYCDRNKIVFETGRKSLKDYTSQIIELSTKGFNCKQIAEALCLDSASLLYHIRKLEIPVRNGKFLIENPEEEKEVVHLFLSGLSQKDVSLKLSIPLKRVSRYLDKHSIERRTSAETYRMNTDTNIHAFSELNEECVYWLGWIITDGCLTEKNSISLSLKGEDIDIVKRFAEYVKPSLKVSVREYFHKQANKVVSTAAASVMSPEIANNLRKHNIEPRKSCKEKLPNFDCVNHDLAPVFWRAVLEGDGYVGKDLKNSRIGLVGSEELLKGFITFCEETCSVRLGKKLYSRKYGNPDFRLLEYTGTDARKIMRKLWSSGSIFLERKKKIVESQLNHWNPMELT